MAVNDGLISMRPSSISVGSGSATINRGGGVDFAGVSSVSLNDVFSTSYDNYLINVVVSSFSGSESSIALRLRAAGSDASGSNYSWQQVIADGTAGLSATRTTNTTSYYISSVSSTSINAYTIWTYAPALAEQTGFASASKYGSNDATIRDFYGVHAVSTAYDGLTLFPIANSITGMIHVFGYEE